MLIMDKIIIHTYPGRLWYVKDFLIPSLIAQGAKNIVIANDKYHIGNLLSFVMSLDNCGDAWHLQDDVIICSDFVQRIQKLSGLCCGFYAGSFDRGNKHEGKNIPQNMWFSFPCIRIPGDIAQAFYNWFFSDEDKDKNTRRGFQIMINSGKMDDLIFMEYLREYYPDMDIFNIKPNLVDHIDYLIGGSVANSQRAGKACSTYFEEPEKVRELAQRLSIYRTAKGG